jgi:glycosyltransferase involved in cell wall biosynthesis
MKTIDILVLPSYREGFPKVIMEAAASGVPAVTTDVVGCRSAVIHNETGFIVRPMDAMALAEKIEKLLASRELRSYMGINARRIAELNFDSNILSNRHANIWN